MKHTVKKSFLSQSLYLMEMVYFYIGQPGNSGNAGRPGCKFIFGLSNKWKNDFCFYFSLVPGLPGARGDEGEPGPPGN